MFSNGLRTAVSILSKACLAGKPYYCVNTYALRFGSTSQRGAAGQPVHSHFFSQSAFGAFVLANQMNGVSRCGLG